MEPEINGVERLLREANPLRGIGHEIAEKVDYMLAVWAQREFYRVADDDYECVDNDRWCRVGFADEEADYAKAADLGCCGFCDWEVTDDSGQSWRFGFNHGH